MMPKLLFIALLCCLVVPTHAQTTVEIVASRDNTLIEPTGAVRSNGAGNSIFAGRVGSAGGQTRRRALLFFDLAADIPAGAQVTDVALRVQVTQTVASVAGTFTLHRVQQAWGEGTSSSTGGTGAAAATNDATWAHTFFPGQQWSQAGGDFAEDARATQSINGPGSYTWASTPELVADVQSWLADPSSNFGWLVKGPEASDKTVRKFASRENSTLAHRPTLLVTYQMPSDVVGDVSGDQLLTQNDALLVLQHLVGLFTLDANQQQRAEVSGNGTLSVVDAGLILAHVAGLRDCFPVEAGCTSGAAFKQNQHVAWGTPRYERTDRVRLPLIGSASVGEPVAVLLQIPLAGKSVQNVAVNTAGWTQAIHMRNDTLFVALAGLPDATDEAWATLVFDHEDSSKPARVQATAQVAEDASQSLADVILFEHPVTLTVSQPYPNPFSTTATLEIVLQDAAHVSLVVYDLQGRKVDQVADAHLEAGVHQFAWTASGQASGTYIYRLEAGRQVVTHPVTLVR